MDSIFQRVLESSFYSLEYPKLFFPLQAEKDERNAVKAQTKAATAAPGGRRKHVRSTTD